MVHRRYYICRSRSRSELPSYRVIGVEIRIVALRGPWLLVVLGDVEAAIFFCEVGHRQRSTSSRLGAGAPILLRVVVKVGNGTVGVDAQRAGRR